ncbi:MAG: ABC transporter permease [Acidobacteria bacterium]|nr:MAG: ABC transporter permease [Acidobacteriota bacterium]
MHGLWQDLRHSLRLLARARGFSATAILVLALGIGANTAVFTVANALLFKPLGGEGGELAGVYLRDTSQAGGFRSFSYPDFRDLSAGQTPFAALAAQQIVPVGVREGQATRKGVAYVVSAGYFATLGVRPSPGRTFDSSEDDPSAPPVVVVSHAYWKKTGADPGCLGRIVTINNRSFTIVGVAPPGFTGTIAMLSPEFWIPIGAAPLVEQAARPGGAGLLSDRGHRALTVVARLQPGVTVESAAPVAAPLASRLREAAPVENKDVEIVLGGLSRLSLSAGPRTDAESAMVMFFLMAMASIVLLIACLNLANMLLARGGARGREVAIRLALGSSRARIVRQLLTESFLLSAAGGALGLLIAMGATTLLARTVLSVIPFAVEFDAAPDVRVLLVTAAVSIVGTLAFGLGPAVRLARTDALPRIKEQAGQLPVRAGRIPVRNLLVVGQLAMCLTLLTGAGLFVRGAFEARSATPGFAMDQGLVTQTDAALAGYDEPRGRHAYRQVAARLRAIPGVESASFASSIPFGLESSFRVVRRIDQGATREPAYAATVVVGADYFRTVRLSVLRGREFSRAEEDAASPARAVIVDEPMARRLWPDENPIGQRVQLDSGEGKDGEWTVPMEVVGVVPGVRDSLFDPEPGAHVYLPFGSEYRPALHLHVRLASGGAAAEGAMAEAIRRELRAADQGLPILSMKTLAEHRDTSIYLWMARAAANVFAAFGLSALLLAVLGVYGVKAYLVSRRTREIGIRVALGATRLDVLTLVLRDGLWLTLGGLAAGVALSVGLSKVLASWVYGVTGVEPSVLLAAGGVLTGATLLACYLPARRAMAMAPSAALRSE